MKHSAELHQNLNQTGAAFCIKIGGKVQGWLTIEAEQAVWRPKKNSENRAVTVSLEEFIKYFKERPGQ